MIEPFLQLLIDNSLTLQWVFCGGILLFALYLLFKMIDRGMRGDWGHYH